MPSSNKKVIEIALRIKSDIEKNFNKIKKQVGDTEKAVKGKLKGIKDGFGKLKGSLKSVGQEAGVFSGQFGAMISKMGPGCYSCCCSRIRFYRSRKGLCLRCRKRRRI